jgi:putative esterase
MRTGFSHRWTIAGALAMAAAAAPATAQAPRFEITVAPSAHAGPLTGRLVLVASKTAQPEPRLVVSPQGPAIFAIDLEQLPAGRAAVIDDKSLGYPMQLAELPPGDYYVQPVINVYEQVKRSDGHTVWLHMNDGQQETFQIAEGNLYGDAQKVTIGRGTGTVRLTVTHVIPPSPRPTDTEWVKYVRIQSQKLTQFWGRPVYVNATVLLPKGYAEHPSARYPTVFTLGHNIPFNFSTDSTRGRRGISPVTGTENGYDFYQTWVADGTPRMIAVSFEQQTPYFPDSYSVNSANNGPYEDAILQEVIPELERRFRMIGKPYARLVEGASTGGWSTLGLQLRNPDFFGGAWVLQPDPIDFKRYQLIDIYSDTNAFVLPNSQLTTTERPFRRTTEGQPAWTIRGLSRFEEVLGTRGRSSYQLEAWEAVYGPVGPDGYPKPLWNKLTGTIDREVANYMRDHGYDLRAYAEKNWATLGPKLAGKLHFFAGDMDDFYLNVAVYRMEDFLKSTTNPKSDATFVYGRPMKGHSWHAWTWGELVKQMGAYVKQRSSDDAAPWNY